MSWTHLGEHTRKARKPNPCTWCGEPLDISKLYVERTGVWEGEFVRLRFHRECEMASRGRDADDWETFSPGDFERGSLYPRGHIGIDEAEVAKERAQTEERLLEVPFPLRQSPKLQHALAANAIVHAMYRSGASLDATILALSRANEDLSNKLVAISLSHPFPLDAAGNSQMDDTGEQSNGHRWGYYGTKDRKTGLQWCRDCGQVRRSDDENPQCRGNNGGARLRMQQAMARITLGSISQNDLDETTKKEVLQNGFVAPPENVQEFKDARQL